MEIETQQQQTHNPKFPDTGTNFFNASEDRLNNLSAEVGPECPAQDDIVQGIHVQYAEKDKVGNCNEMDCEEEMGKKLRYGNHRNKTTRGFERANLKAALRQKQQQSNRFHKNKQVPCLPPQLFFSIYSPGIYLFFSFLKKSTLLFAILSLLSLSPILYNSLNGDAFAYEANTFQVVIARMMVGNQQNIDVESQSTKDKIFIMIPVFMGVGVFLGFFVYWWRWSQGVANERREKFKRVSDFTIEVTQFQEHLSQKEIEKFFQKYGDINQIAAVKNYEQMIDLSKQIYELSLQIKQKMLINATEAKTTVSESYTKFIAQKQEKMNKLLEKLSRIEQKLQKKNIKYYIRFQQEQSKQKVLKDYERFNGIFGTLGKKIPQHLKIGNKLPRVKSCIVQPSQIVWQNIHIRRKSRWARFLLQFILISIIIVLGFIFISILNISTPPTSYNNLETNNLSFVDVENATFSVKYTWCLNTGNLSPDQVRFCQPYRNSYVHRILLSIAITVAIIVTKSVLKQIMVRIAHFQRYKNHTQLSTNIMTNLFVTYISTTIMITFLLQANIFGISFKGFMNIFVSDPNLIENLSFLEEYFDFQPYWYKDIGYQIWMNWLVLSIFPHTLLPIYYFVKQRIGIKMAQKQVLQKNVKKWIQAQQFQIQDHYANILMLIFVGFIFSGGIPFMLPLTLIGLATRFLVLKYIFVRFCRIPNYYTESMNERAKIILQLALIIHLGVTIWMYGVNDIFGDFDRISVFGVGDYNEQDGNWLHEVGYKLTAHWYLSLLLAVVGVLLLFYGVVFGLVMKLLNRSANDKDNDAQKQNNNEEINEKPTQNQQKIKITQVCLTESYKIQNNPNYFQILAIMKPQQIRNTQNLFPFMHNLLTSVRPPQ